MFTIRIGKVNWQNKKEKELTLESAEKNAFFWQTVRNDFFDFLILDICIETPVFFLKKCPEMS